MPKKVVLGLTERIEVIGEHGVRTVKARIDTGASISSIDKKLAKAMGVNHILGSRIIKQAHGMLRRPIVRIHLRLKGRELKGKCSLADRSHMAYKLLIGRNILKQGFIIDPLR